MVFSCFLANEDFTLKFDVFLRLYIHHVSETTPTHIVGYTS